MSNAVSYVARPYTATCSGDHASGIVSGGGRLKGGAGLFSHVFLGVSDFGRALAFYRAVLPSLGLEERFCEHSRPWAGWQVNPGQRPLFLIGKPYDGCAHEAGNGQMVALLTQGRAVVDAVYAVALRSGGSSEGGPGLRPEYTPTYYGAYFRDTEGNKICVACHSPS
ncbi:MAG TPA: VOC family protein [Steroidobacteraceae bacterium]